ncbi:MAG: DUF3427 domain-containing protein [Verrucomicrobiales bacterium]
MVGKASHLTTGDQDPFLPKLIDEINKATHIDIAVSFIRSTGLNLLYDALLDAVVSDDGSKSKVKLRIITGDYMGITQPEALRRLMLLTEEGAEVKIFESRGQSFHMKSYIFLHDGDPAKGSAFVGSSNITGSALKSGLEWNLRVDRDENFERFDEIVSKYESLFAHEKALSLSHDWIDSYQKKLADIPQLPVGELFDAPGEVDDVEEEIFSPNDIQKEALAALVATREEGFARGLVVLATGMGKTWLAAFDVKALDAKKVLFVAHREEILFQAEKTFLAMNPDCRVGRYMGATQEAEADYLFASVQTIGKKPHLNKFDPDHFDYVIVDEFHHAAARTYQQLLAHFTPKFLLGLTATPERTDQADILSLCDNNLVYEKGLYDGIEASILSVFSYFGIGDEEVDYSEIPWRNGKFDADALLNKLATQARASHIFKKWQEYKQTRTLAFCVSQKHADFMADYFNKKGVKSVSVHSDSTVRRNVAIQALAEGSIEVLFSVDLFNEGVDVPSIDTVLMLRPTESKIIFLQQLGRGLRLSEETNKEKLNVVDFIGNHVSFFKKVEALFNVDVNNRARKQFIDDAKEKNLSLPDGCFVNYDLTAIEIMEKLIPEPVDSPMEIYRNLKASLGRRPSLVECYRGGAKVNAIRQEFGQWFGLVETEGDLEEDGLQVYKQYKDFFLGVEKGNMTKSFKMILLEAMLELEGFTTAPTTKELALKSLALLRRRRDLLSEVPEEFVNSDEMTEVIENRWISYWKRNPINAWTGSSGESAGTFFSLDNDRFKFRDLMPEGQVEVFEELLKELINYRLMNYEARGGAIEPLALNPDNPLLYREFLKKDVPELFGLEYIEGLWKMFGHVIPRDSNDQFLFITLIKQGTEENYQYLDYFRDSSHLHWQTQNKTTPENAKGLGVINHEGNNSLIHLFVRKRAKIKGKGAPFTYCGEVSYLSHKGSGPMDVELGLVEPLPDELLRKFS